MSDTKKGAWTKAFLDNDMRHPPGPDDVAPQVNASTIVSREGPISRSAEDRLDDWLDHRRKDVKVNMDPDTPARATQHEVNQAPRSGFSGPQSNPFSRDPVNRVNPYSLFAPQPNNGHATPPQSYSFGSGPQLNSGYPMLPPIYAVGSSSSLNGGLYPYPGANPDPYGPQLLLLPAGQPMEVGEAMAYNEPRGRPALEQQPLYNAEPETDNDDITYNDIANLPYSDLDMSGMRSVRTGLGDRVTLTSAIHRAEEQIADPLLRHETVAHIKYLFFKIMQYKHRCGIVSDVEYTGPIARRLEKAHARFFATGVMPRTWPSKASLLAIHLSGPAKPIEGLGNRIAGVLWDMGRADLLQIEAVSPSSHAATLARREAPNAPAAGPSRRDLPLQAMQQDVQALKKEITAEVKKEITAEVKSAITAEVKTAIAADITTGQLSTALLENKAGLRMLREQVVQVVDELDEFMFNQATREMEEGSSVRALRKEVASNLKACREGAASANSAILDVFKAYLNSEGRRLLSPDNSNVPMSMPKPANTDGLRAPPAQDAATSQPAGQPAATPAAKGKETQTLMLRATNPQMQGALLPSQSAQRQRHSVQTDHVYDVATSPFPKPAAKRKGAMDGDEAEQGKAGVSTSDDRATRTKRPRHQLLDDK